MEVECVVSVLALDTKSVQPFATQDEYVYAMKEDLAEWFNALYDLSIAVTDFFEQIETGVTICQHANNVQSFIKEQIVSAGKGGGAGDPSAFGQQLPAGFLERSIQYRSNVKAGSFQARDNVSNFIAWCKALGINNVILFETEDLVLRKNERHVVLCLLEVARRGAQYGMLAPTLVQMEHEIDAEMAGTRPPELVPQVQRKTCDLMSLDEMVREMVSVCTCPDQFPMVQVSDGKYKIGESRTVIFVRILRNHVMVRIGGGWDTLQNYLDRHDPCRCDARGHKGRVAGIIPTKLHARRQSAPATQVLDGQRMRTATPSADSVRNQRTGTPGTRSKRSQSIVPKVNGESTWRPSKTATTTSALPPRSFDPMVPSPRGCTPSPTSSEASQASSQRAGAGSMWRDSGLGGRRDADSASDASSSCGGSPGLHKRFSSATDLSFPKELTLSSVTENALPRMRPTSARDRVRRAAATSSSSSTSTSSTPTTSSSGIPTASPGSNNNNNNAASAHSSSGRGRQKQKTPSPSVTSSSSRQARSRSVEPVELNNERFAPRKLNSTANSRPSAPPPPGAQRQEGGREVLIISRDRTGKHRIGPPPVSTPPSGGDPFEQDAGSQPSSTSSSMSGPSTHSHGSSSSASGGGGGGGGYTSSGCGEEDRRPSTPRLNISPDRTILPDKPKLMSRSHTADLGHVGETCGDDSTDTDTDSRGTRTASTKRMCVSSNQSSTLSLASSFDDYPDAPPEDRSLNAEMERLFEEYRRKEIREQKKLLPNKKSALQHRRHRRSNSVDLLEMEGSSSLKERRWGSGSGGGGGSSGGGGGFPRARTSSRELLNGGAAGWTGGAARRAGNVAGVGRSASASCSASSTPRRAGPITPKPTRASTLRGALGMARELRNKLAEQSTTGWQSPVRGGASGGGIGSNSSNPRRPATPLTNDGAPRRPAASGGSRQVASPRGRSQARATTTAGGSDDAVDCRARSVAGSVTDSLADSRVGSPGSLADSRVGSPGSLAGSRVGSRADSRASSRNSSRDSSVTRMRPSSSMSHREQQQQQKQQKKPAAAAVLPPAVTPGGTGCPGEDGSNTPPTPPLPLPPLIPGERLTCQTDPSPEKDQEQQHGAHTPKPRKDKHHGRTRIPMPVDMLAGGKYDPDDQPLRRYDSGVDINNMSPTESSVHGDDDVWQQELMLMEQPEQGAPRPACPGDSGGGVGGGGVGGGCGGVSVGPNGYDDMF